MHFFLLSIYAQIFLNAYIIRRGYQALALSRSARLFFVLFVIIELILFFTGYFFHKELPDAILHFIMMVCNTWYVASIYFTLGLVVLDMIRLVDGFYPRYFKDMDSRRKKKLQLALFCVFVVSVTGLMIKGYDNAIHPVARHVDIHIPKVVPGRDSMKIVLISDLHIGEFIGKKQVQHFVELCNAERPDLIVIAGDVIDYELRNAESEHMEEDLRRLYAPLGVYMALGNHEYRAGIPAKLRWLRKTGAILLVDSVAMPDSSFYLIGRDAMVNTNRASLQTLMQGVEVDKPVIVVGHEPDYSMYIFRNQCDIGLYGHTHNGQYWPFSLLMTRSFKFPYFFHAKTNEHVYVSSGIGFAGAPFRIGTRSELVVLHLKFKV